MTDEEILTLCAFEEANLEPDQGVAAVARVVLNRTKLKYMSNGTIPGTVFRHDQFSWTEWTMVNGRYLEVAKTPEQVQERAQRLIEADQSYAKRWDRARTIVDQVLAGTFTGPAYDLLGDHAVNYYNPAICHAPWATSDKFIVAIGHHSFYRA